MDMTYDNGRGDGPEGGWRRWIKPVLLVVVLGGIGALIWHFANDKAAVKRATAPEVTTVIPLPPPPPPPPPQQKPQEKPEEQAKTPVERPTDVPKPAAPPKPADSQPQQMTMNAPAQAGTDGFNISSGSGGGMGAPGSGDGTGGFGGGLYNQYIGYILQRAVEGDKHVRESGASSRVDVKLNLWMESSGTVTKVSIAQSTGDARLDDAIVGAVESIGRVDSTPPADTTYPVSVTMHLRLPG
ncbi:MAG TPA: energy transducer TonB [Pararobbsia sp.]|nr:energy transducer TonB [Pararobbsia sp.]